MLDVGGLSLGLLNVMPLFKVVNTVGSSYFPERTINILVLNAPRVFKQLWSIVRPAARRQSRLRRVSRPSCATPAAAKAGRPAHAEEGAHPVRRRAAADGCACVRLCAMLHVADRRACSAAHVSRRRGHPGLAGWHAPGAVPQRQRRA